MAILGVVMALSFLYCVHRIAVATWSGVTQAGQTRHAPLAQAIHHEKDKTSRRIFYITALVTFDGEVSHHIFSGGVQVPNSTPDDVRQVLGQQEGGKLYKQLR